MKKYIPHDFEDKWKQKWLTDKTYKTPDSISKENKVYILGMFPYPSGAGLHVGHGRIFTATDVLARFYRMQGNDILYPMGWDAFGLPTENYAIKTGIKPQVATEENINTFRSQMQSLGLSYDWDREFSTTDPDYYKWTQWLFQQIYRQRVKTEKGEQGLVYRKLVPINWCPKCKTGLADEEVLGDGTHERCGTRVEKREMPQWLIRITAYADRLLNDLQGLDWPQGIIEMQKNWIGKSTGSSVIFPVEDSKEPIRVFTTRIDTLFGVTAVVVAPEHPLVQKVKDRKEVAEYLQEVKGKSELERTDLAKEKTGVFSGLFALHPVTGEKLPIWIADYVIGWYGDGAVMMVPAHDERDGEFAKKYNLPFKTVIEVKGKEGEIVVEYGTLVNSQEYTGLSSKEAQKKITEDLEKQGLASFKTMYKLRDWIFSRQRYWGEPFPFVYCGKCGDENGVVLVPEDQLPVTLPEVEKYEPTDTGESPLAAITDWVNTTCPSCGGPAKRETDTMPNWAGSCWYFLRFCDPKNSVEAFNKEKTDTLMPVDWYLGGAEHAVLHLLYARMWQKVFYDQKLTSILEPFQRLRSVGLVLATDKRKMSKSLGNVINPDDLVKRYGADTLRTYEMFMGPWSQALPWDTQGLIGVYRFLGRTYSLFSQLHEDKQKGNAPANGDLANSDNKNSQLEVETKIAWTTKKVTIDTRELRFNTAVAALMELLNTFYKHQSVLTVGYVKTFLLLLAPYAPFMAEELWHTYGFSKESNSIHKAKWPTYDESRLVEETVSIAVQVNGKLRDIIEIEKTDIDNQTLIEEKARQSEKVQKYISGGVSKTIYVSGKILSFVVRV